MTEETSSEEDLFSPHVLSDPNPFYARAFRNGPVIYVPSRNAYAVLSYDLVLKVADDPATYSSRFGELLKGRGATDPEIKAILAKGWPFTDSLISNDPPVHSRYRRLVNRAFTMPRVNAMEEEIRRTARELVTAMAMLGRCDFVAEFAVKLPVAVIGRLLDSADLPIPLIKGWSDAFMDLLGGVASRDRQIECAHQVIAFQRHFVEKIDQRRADLTIDDMIGSLVHARTVEDDQPLNDPEILSVIQALLIAGNETTTSTLAEGLKLLIDHPDQMAKVLTNPKCFNNMIEEVLRLASPASGLWRIVTRDTELGGVALKEGALLNLRFAGANRDPVQFSQPDLFDVERANARTHLAFGRGIHMCIGNMLARKELAVGFEELFAQLEQFRITDRDALKYPPNMLARGLEAMPLEFQSRTELPVAIR